MTPRLIVWPEAEGDIDEAVRWYEEQRPGLGAHFVDELDHVLERIVEAPQHFPEVDVGVRRGLVRRFPYAIYFVPGPRRVVVVAVLHLRRHPDTWKRQR